MALSLAFHIVFAAIGIGMPLLMAIAEGLYLRRGEAIYLDLAKRWARGTAILFAVGAVSGTVLSFELGLLWPRFMEYAGGIIGMPFSLEGFAFFTEAIFLGIYLYGWDRTPPLMHWISGIIVAGSGMLSGVFVVTVNAWMNAPTGFEVTDGRVTSIDPIAAMLNPASLQQVIHMTLAAYVATGFIVAAVHAFFLLRDRRNVFHRRALGIALAVAAVGIPFQIVSGDMIARMVAERQPAKFAAMEGHYRTQRGAPLTIGGLPDDAAMTTRYALRIPPGLSLLAHGDPTAPVRGHPDVRTGRALRHLHRRLRLSVRHPRVRASPAVPRDSPERAGSLGSGPGSVAWRLSSRSGPPSWWRSCSTPFRVAPTMAAACGTCWPWAPKRRVSARPSSTRSDRSGRPITSGSSS